MCNNDLIDINKKFYDFDYYLFYKNFLDKYFILIYKLKYSPIFAPTFTILFVFFLNRTFFFNVDKW